VKTRIDALRVQSFSKELKDEWNLFRIEKFKVSSGKNDKSAREILSSIKEWIYSKILIWLLLTHKKIILCALLLEKNGHEVFLWRRKKELLQEHAKKVSRYLR
jgi:hypothetical protein